MSDAITAPKSWVQTFVERNTKGIQNAAPKTPASYVRETGSTFAKYATGGAVGALLGAGHARFGLDTPGGPIDGWVAGMGALAAIGLSGHSPGIASIAGAAGSQAFGIFAFRKSYELVKHSPLPGGSSGGTVQRVAAPVTAAGKGPAIAGEDPIERVARGLG